MDVIGLLGFLLALGLAAKALWEGRKHRLEGQIAATHVSAEFVGYEEKNPICRATCYNNSSAPLYDVMAYVDWYAVTDWEDGSPPELCKAIEGIGFFTVEPNSMKTNEFVCSGNVVVRPETPVGAFPVFFACTDAHKRRWGKWPDGTIRRDPEELGGERETMQGGPIP